MKLVLIAFLGLLAVVSAQWPGSNNQNYPQFPNQNAFSSQQFPNINNLCDQPGANCKIDSRFAEDSSVTDERGQTTKYTRVCDNNGCYGNQGYNPASPSYYGRSASSAVSTNAILVTICALLISAKIYFS